LPAVIQFTNGNRKDYVYGADGVKRRVIHTTATANVSVPMGEPFELTAAQIQDRDTIDYCGNLIYENGILKMILHPEGYITTSGTNVAPTYHYYLKDHQGNNRVVTLLGIIAVLLCKSLWKPLG
jgi:hypothetical protein